ncbi:MAG TPA: hypothetical protein VFS40_00295 [Gemmatimonadales bacterium]|nr:hypothetical protein [Gemmatimonadales bacterium]
MLSPVTSRRARRFAELAHRRHLACVELERTRRHFRAHLLRNAGVGATVIGTGLLIGVLGYHAFEHLPWLDALLNASMILSGMGPVNPVRTEAGKWFAAFYALFSGVAFISAVGVLFVPVMHRFLHRFHLEFAAEAVREAARRAAAAPEEEES